MDAICNRDFTKFQSLTLMERYCIVFHVCVFHVYIYIYIYLRMELYSNEWEHKRRREMGSGVFSDIEKLRFYHRYDCERWALAVCGQPEPVISECWIAGEQAGAYFISVVSHQSARLSD